MKRKVLIIAALFPAILSLLLTINGQLPLPFTVYGQVLPKGPVSVNVKCSTGIYSASVNGSGFYYVTIGARPILDWVIVEADDGPHFGYLWTLISTKTASSVRLDPALMFKVVSTVRTVTLPTTVWVNATSLTTYTFQAVVSTTTKWTTTTATFTIVSPTETTQTQP